MNQHTQGPWEWRRHSPKHAWEIVARHSGTLLVMDCVRYGVNGAQLRFAIRSDNMGGLMHRASDLDVPNHPDARLMVTAPELLAALSDLMDVQNGPPLITLEKEWRAAMAAAESAIAKATGGAA